MDIREANVSRGLTVCDESGTGFSIEASAYNQTVNGQAAVFDLMHEGKSIRSVVTF